MMLPVLTHHIRYHQCLMHLDELIGYVFKERCLLQVRTAHCRITGMAQQSEFNERNYPRPLKYSSLPNTENSGREVATFLNHIEHLISC